MKLIVAQDDVELVDFANRWLKQNIKQNEKSLVLLPAGNTPVQIYKNWESTHPDFLNFLKFQQLDEIVSGPRAGYFCSFFETHLPSYKSQFIKLTDSPEKCDLAVLGVGLNGHLAFHEPEINFTLNYGCVRLSASTLISLNIDDPTWGLTYGVQQFMGCKSVLIIANGLNKKEIVQKSLNEKNPTTAFSYVIKNHRDCTIIVDQKSYNP